MNNVTILQFLAAFVYTVICVIVGYAVGYHQGHRTGHHQGYMKAVRTCGDRIEQSDNTIRKKQTKIQTLERRVRHLEREKS